MTFIRDTKLVGFGVKVTPNGRISYIAEGRIRGGRTRRITLGQYPALSLSQARQLATDTLFLMQQGKDPKTIRDTEAAKERALSKSLADVFREYMKTKNLKASTVRDYNNTFELVFSEWKALPIKSISRSTCEKKFIETRESRGLPTAAKAFRIISAIFNYAMADEIDGHRLIKENPVDVIRQKKISRKVKARDRFLSDKEISKLIHYYHIEKDWPETRKHGVSAQGINYVMLLLCSGLRKGEALSLRWNDIDWDNKCFVVGDTKNATDHSVPMSAMLQIILRNQMAAVKVSKKKDSEWVFPARNGSGHMTEPKSQLEKICSFNNISFRLHDLRRTFATHAQANGISLDLIRRALNHKSGGITEGYLLTQIETIRPVFDAVADGYHRYYDPNWKSELEAENAFQEEVTSGQRVIDTSPLPMSDFSTANKN